MGVTGTFGESSAKKEYLMPSNPIDVQRERVAPTALRGCEARGENTRFSV
jgi:hypothetical protein